MIFHELEVQNFLSIQHIKLSLKDRGLVLVLGKVEGSPSFSSNGAGKSNLFESLNWLLYDRLLRANKHTNVKRKYKGQVS